MTRYPRRAVRAVHVPAVCQVDGCTRENARINHPYCVTHKFRFLRCGHPEHSVRDWSRQMVQIRVEASRYLMTPEARLKHAGPLRRLVAFLAFDAPAHPSCRPMRDTMRRLAAGEVDHRRGGAVQEASTAAQAEPVPLHRMVCQLVARLVWSLRHRPTDLDLGPEYLAGNCWLALDMLAPVAVHINGYRPRRTFKSMAQAGGILMARHSDTLQALARDVVAFVRTYPNQKAPTPYHVRRRLKREQDAAPSESLAIRLRNADDEKRHRREQTPAQAHHTHHRSPGRPVRPPTATTTAEGTDTDAITTEATQHRRSAATVAITVSAGGHQRVDN